MKNNHQTQRPLEDLRQEIQQLAGTIHDRRILSIVCRILQMQDAAEME